MNSYVALTYAVALALLWGYAGALWLQSRTQLRLERAQRGGRS
jgi:hypothetical protein